MRLSLVPDVLSVPSYMKLLILTCLLLAMFPAASAAEEPATTTDATTAGRSGKISPKLRAAVDKLSLPGVKINLDEWSVDVESRVCLGEGLLELIACTKDTKEHESIIMVEAKPSHIHIALLLLGAKPGNPAMQQAIDPEMTRFRSKPPSGSPVDVFLVFKDSEGKEKEHPINEFMGLADEDDRADLQDPEHGGKFPTHTFLFAGSVLVGGGEQPRRYLCDQSGNVISISTFGDELLCLPGIHDDANGALIWQVEGDKLPEVDSKITLRLRPQVKLQSAPESKSETPAGE